MMNKALFIERLACFGVPLEKYLQIYSQVDEAEKLSAEEVGKRVAQIAFAGYVTRGNQLVVESSAINEACLSSAISDGCQNSADCLRLIPYAGNVNMIGLRTVRRMKPFPEEWKKIATVQVYSSPEYNGVPCLTPETAVSQLPADIAQEAKAFALCLDDDFVEKSYSHLLRMYKFKLEVFA